MQLEQEDQAKFPLQLASNGGGNPDIEFRLSCRAGTTSDLTIGRLQVSGWKDPSEDVVVEAD